MKSIRTNPRREAVKGDERIRTAVTAPGADPVYERHAAEFAATLTDEQLVAVTDAIRGSSKRGRRRRMLPAEVLALAAIYAEQGRRDELLDERKAFLHNASEWQKRAEAAEAELQAVVSALPGLPAGRPAVEFAQDIAVGARRAVAEKEAAEAEIARLERELANCEQQFSVKYERMVAAEAEAAHQRLLREDAEAEVARLRDGLRRIDAYLDRCEEYGGAPSTVTIRGTTRALRDPHLDGLAQRPTPAL